MMDFDEYDEAPEDELNRILWADAVADGSARASGERADLSTYLPLL